MIEKKKTVAEICAGNVVNAKRRREEMRERYPFVAAAVDDLRSEGIDIAGIKVTDGDYVFEWRR